MYIPKHFQVHPEAAHRLIRQNPFGLLLTRADNGVEGGHLPFILQTPAGGPGVLAAHMARGNRQWRDLQDDDRALVVFSGPHAYISPSWYAAPLSAVPTWNYQAVHVYGRARIMNEDELHEHLREMTAIYETGELWRFEKMELESYRKRLKAIVGVEIRIEDIQAKFKLSQNRSVEDRRAVIAQLRRQDETSGKATADAIEQDIV